MSKYPPPKFYATDKDVHDLLSRLDTENIITSAKNRGIIVSHQSRKDSVVSYLARQMYSHPQLNSLLKFLETEDREEKITPSKVDANVELTEVAQAFQQVRDERKDPDEQMTIEQRPSGELEVKVKYTHLDVSMATLRQRTAKEITFVVQKDGEILDFSYNNNAKAAEIYSEVKAKLKGEQPVTITECVSLNGIQDSEKRTQFFLDLMNGIEGFRLRTVKHIKAERLKKDQTSDAEEENEGTAEEMEEMVKKMALGGGSVCTSPEFKSMVANGFFIHNARWLATETDGENRTVEFDAGFSTGECMDFSIRVLGVYKRNSDGSLEKKLTTLGSSDRETLRRNVQESAFQALEKIQPPKDENSVRVDVIPDSKGSEE